MVCVVNEQTALAGEGLGGGGVETKGGLVTHFIFCDGAETAGIPASEVAAVLTVIIKKKKNTWF